MGFSIKVSCKIGKQPEVTVIKCCLQKQIRDFPLIVHCGQKILGSPFFLKWFEIASWWEKALLLIQEI